MDDKISKIQFCNKELHFKTLALPNTFLKQKFAKKTDLVILEMCTTSMPGNVTQKMRKFARTWPKTVQKSAKK